MGKVLIPLMLVPLLALGAIVYSAPARAQATSDSCGTNYDRCRAMCNGSYNAGSCSGACLSRYNSCLGNVTSSNSRVHVGISGWLRSDYTATRH